MRGGLRGLLLLLAGCGSPSALEAALEAVQLPVVAAPASGAAPPRVEVALLADRLVVDGRAWAGEGAPPPVVVPLQDFRAASGERRGQIIVPLFDAVAPLVRRGVEAELPETGEVRLWVDAAAPLPALRDVVYTLGQASVSTPHLQLAGAGGAVDVPLQLPGIGVPPRTLAPALVPATGGLRLRELSRGVDLPPDLGCAGAACEGAVAGRFGALPPPLREALPWVALGEVGTVGDLAPVLAGLQTGRGAAGVVLVGGDLGDPELDLRPRPAHLRLVRRGPGCRPTDRRRHPGPALVAALAPVAQDLEDVAGVATGSAAAWEARDRLPLAGPATVADPAVAAVVDGVLEGRAVGRTTLAWGDAPLPLEVVDCALRVDVEWDGLPASVPLAAGDWSLRLAPARAYTGVRAGGRPTTTAAARWSGDACPPLAAPWDGKAVAAAPVEACCRLVVPGELDLSGLPDAPDQGATWELTLLRLPAGSCG